jgi:hypothetical protein
LIPFFSDERSATLPDYSCVSRRAKSVNVSFKTPTRGEIAHLVIDSTGLKVFGEGEWKVKKHGQERRRIWRKLHLAVDSKTHEIICADLSLNNVTDSEAFPGLIRQTHRKIRAAAADGAYDTRLCHDELRRKKISALIPPRKGAGYWPGEYADRNRAVANQRMTGSNAVEMDNRLQPSLDSGNGDVPGKTAVRGFTDAA